MRISTNFEHFCTKFNQSWKVLQMFASVISTNFKHFCTKFNQSWKKVLQMFASVINQHSFYSISADVTLSRPNWGQRYSKGPVRHWGITKIKYVTLSKGALNCYIVFDLSRWAFCPTLPHVIFIDSAQGNFIVLIHCFCDDWKFWYFEAIYFPYLVLPSIFMCDKPY